LVDAYGEKSPGIYDTLLKSARTVAAEQDKILAGLGANRSDAVTEMLPFETGEDLATTRSGVCTSLDKTRSRLITAVYTYTNEKAGAEHDVKAAGEAIEAAKAKVVTAQQDVTNWNATLAVLETSVAELPSISQSASDSQQDGLDTLQKQLQAAGDKEVQYIDANGTPQTRKIRDILKDQINVTGDGKPLLNLPDAPGATVAILTLGVDLARVQKQAAEAKLSQLSRRLQLYERVQAEIELASALLSDIGKPCPQSVTPFIVDSDVSFNVKAVLLADEARAAEQASTEAAKPVGEEKEKPREQRLIPQIQKVNSRTLELVNDLIKLRKLAIAQAITTRTSMDLDVTEARLGHEESILDSQVNDVAWRTVIRSGVVVLDQYEQGGFTAQDAANIISIAQTIAVGVIAGRVQ
jgi:hypothetical protein